MSNNRGNFDRTREALSAYDKHVEKIHLCNTDKEEEAWAREEQRLSRLVSKAYASDTPFNDRKEVLDLVRPVFWTRNDFLHHIVEEIEE